MEQVNFYLKFWEANMTLTDIANMALEDISERGISSIDDEEDALAGKLKRRISKSIREVQAAHSWSCISHTEKLVRNGVLPTGESLFIQPPGFLKTIDACPNVAWHIEGKSIVAPVRELCLRYVRYSENPDEWDIHLQSAIVARLRADIALNVSGDSKIAQLAYQQAQVEIPRYIRNDIYGRRNRHLPQTHIFDGW